MNTFDEWTDGCDFSYAGRVSGEAALDVGFIHAMRHEKFIMITREAFYEDVKRHGVDIYALVKITINGDVRKFYASDFGWLEVPPQGPTRAKKPTPWFDLLEKVA